MPWSDLLHQLPKILAPQVVGPLWLATSLLLFQGRVAEALGMTQLVSEWRVWLGLAWLGSTSTLAWSALEPLRLKLQRYQSRRSSLRYVDTLTNDERYLLRQFVVPQRKSVQLEIDGVAAGLNQAGIISRPTNLAVPIPGAMLSHYNINAAVYKKLCETPELLALPDDYSSPDSMREFYLDEI